MNLARSKLAALLLSLLTLPLAADEPASRRPNILFIITDDQERSQFNFLPEGRDERGRPRNLTPNIDRLVASGVAFPNQYVSSPVCTPSRFSCLTGLYASRASDFRNNLRRGRQVNITWNSHVDPRTPNIARVLREAGYFTGGVGKNHVIQSESNPGFRVPFERSARDPEVARLLRRKQAAQVQAYRECGFDFAASIYEGNLGRNHSTRDTECHNMDWITRGALDFFEAWKDTGKPFFLYFATTLDHGPGPANRKYTGDPLATAAGFLATPLKVQPPRDSLPRRVREAGLDVRSTACDVLWLDDAVGALLDRLEALKQMDNTVIFFFNDHGVENGKGSLYEGGIRSVSFVSGPERLVRRRGRISDVALSNVDFVPTILELCGVPRPADHAIDGESFAAVLRGDDSRVHDFLYFEIGATRAVIRDGWKYLAFRLPEEARNMSIERRRKLQPENPDAPFTHLADRPGGRGSEQPAIRFYPNYYDRDQLYDLRSDRLERVNLFADPAHRKTLAGLQALLRRTLAGVPGPYAEFTGGREPPSGPLGAGGSPVDPIDLEAIPSPRILAGSRENNYRDPAAVYHDGWFRLWFTVNRPRRAGRSMVSRIGTAKSRDLVHWSEVELITREDRRLNYSSPGNVVRRGDEWILCFQSYPIPGDGHVGDSTARLFIARSRDLETWSEPELLRVKGPDTPVERMGRMIDPYLLEDRDEPGKWWCFYKQRGVSLSWTRDFETWHFFGRTESGENVTVLVDRETDEYVLLHSPSNGLGLKRSRDLRVWRDRAGLITLDQENWPWARARLTAGTILDLRREPRVGKYLLFFHGAASAEPHRHIGGCSLGLAWSDDLVHWEWPG